MVGLPDARHEAGRPLSTQVAVPRQGSIQQPPCPPPALLGKGCVGPLAPAPRYKTARRRPCPQCGPYMKRCGSLPAKNFWFVQTIANPDGWTLLLLSSPFMIHRRCSPGALRAASMAAKTDSRVLSKEW